MMLGDENRSVRFLDERQQLNEVVEVIIDGQNRQSGHADLLESGFGCSTFVSKAP
jgi:hypothetical protein